MAAAERAPEAAGNAPGIACGTRRRGRRRGTPAVTLTVDAASPGATWNRFYEGAVATDHANTLLTAAWGRNAQNALKKGHDEAGFRYARFHGILNRDIGVYPDVAPALATETPAYNWARFDQVYDAVVAAGHAADRRDQLHAARARVERDADPGAALVQRRVAQHQQADHAAHRRAGRCRPGITGRSSWRTSSRHLEERYGVDEVRNNWYFEVWNEATWMYAAGAAGYNELYRNTALGLMRGDPQVKVGGPADSGGNSPNAIPGLIDFVQAASQAAEGLKLDFITYHHYGRDGERDPRRELERGRLRPVQAGHHAP